jgi:hypothetical protein
MHNSNTNYKNLKDRPLFALAIDQIGAENQNNVCSFLQMEPDENGAIKKQVHKIM